MHFASDNNSGVCPEVLDALSAESARTAPAYGNDPTSAALVERLTEVFEHPVEVYPLATGTAANSVALAAMNPQWGGVVCETEAHIAVDELAAPTVLGNGLTLMPLHGTDGRLEPGALSKFLELQVDDVHWVPPTTLSLTNSTEAGTVYQAEDVWALAQIARAEGLGVHLDGARFANAVAATGATPAQLTWQSGVDVLCLGATKGGALAAEALVVFRPEAVTSPERHRKRTGHLLSKQRLVAAQFLGWLTDDVWLRHAAHANGLATLLAEGFVAAGHQPVHRVQTNMVFLHLPHTVAKEWHTAGAEFYVLPTPDPAVGLARFVTSWSTTDAEVDALLTLAGS
ncbi:MAG: threonine aldolase family protein [Actinomycetes bacterium]